MLASPSNICDDDDVSKQLTRCDDLGLPNLEVSEDRALRLQEDEAATGQPPWAARVAAWQVIGAAIGAARARTCKKMKYCGEPNTDRTAWSIDRRLRILLGIPPPGSDPPLSPLPELRCALELPSAGSPPLSALPCSPAAATWASRATQHGSSSDRQAHTLALGGVETFIKIFGIFWKESHGIFAGDTSAASSSSPSSTWSTSTAHASQTWFAGHQIASQLSSMVVSLADTT